MTLEQADAARRRAAGMLENFGDGVGAGEFDSMTPEEYAEHKGIELVSANPKHRSRKGVAIVLNSTKRRLKAMAKSKALEDAHDTVKDIYDEVQEAGATRADMETTLNTIADLCTKLLPELDMSDDEDSEDGDDDSMVSDDEEDE